MSTNDFTDEAVLELNKVSPLINRVDLLEQFDSTFIPGYTTVIPVGGLTGSTNIGGQTAIEVLDKILSPELFPTILTLPTITFTINHNGLKEIGETLTIIKTRNFVNGIISPQYLTDFPYRSYGIDTSLGVNGFNELGDDGEYIVIPGIKKWTSEAYYLAGPIPKGSKGTSFSSALGAGITSKITRTITGVYPIFATVTNLQNFNKLALLNDGADITVTLAAEALETPELKQRVQIPKSWGNITILQQFNPYDFATPWANISLNSFSKTTIVKMINGNSVYYWEYEHQDSTIGERQLKFKVS